MTEGVIRDISELRDIEIVDHPNGIEARLWLTPAAAARAAERQRAMVGPVGCGLCGIDSLEKVERPLPPLARSAAAVDPRRGLRRARPSARAPAGA